jgi:hypothetical protein
MHIFKLVLFALGWGLVLYLFNCVLAKKVKRIEIKPAVMYMSMMAMLGVFGEVLFGSFYHAITGKVLWHYRIYPIHNAYTSMYAIWLWAIYGFHLYLLHGSLKNKRWKPTNVPAVLNFHNYVVHGQKTGIKRRALHRLAIWFGIEAIIIEALVNLTFLAIFNSYIYYYYPGDLWHLTSLQAFPFYVIAGYFILLTANNFKKSPGFFSFFSLSAACIFVFLA